MSFQIYKVDPYSLLYSIRYLPPPCSHRWNKNSTASTFQVPYDKCCKLCRAEIVVQ